MSLFTWFLLPVPCTNKHEDLRAGMRFSVSVCVCSSHSWLTWQDLRYSRLQKRMIHRLSQHIETGLHGVMAASLPALRGEHELHPCTKILDFIMHVCPCCSETSRSQGWKKLTAGTEGEEPFGYTALPLAGRGLHVSKRRPAPGTHGNVGCYARPLRKDRVCALKALLVALTCYGIDAEDFKDHCRFLLAPSS